MTQTGPENMRRLGAFPVQPTYLAAIILAGSALAWTALAAAQDADARAAEATPQESPPKDADTPLSTQQSQVADRFRELERLLLRMAELTAPTDPRRAALLRRAVAQSKDRAIEQQFDALLELLRQQRLAAVVKNQGEVQTDLVKLLELLLSEDRSKRIESEKERIREYLKRVNKIIQEQKGVQGETRRQGDAEKLAEQQNKLAEKTGQLAQDIDANSPKKPNAKDAEKDANKDANKPADDKPKDGKQGEPKDGGADSKKSDKDGKKPDQDADKPDKNKKPKDSPDKPGDTPKDGKPGEGQDQKPSDLQGEAPPVEPPSQDQQSQGGGDQSEQSQQNPAQQRLEQAKKRMQEAQKKLEEAKRNDATEKQAEALRELERAKAELEEILRQLREEEMSRTLAMLEGRFRKMLEAQIAVYEGTKRLDKVPEQQRDRDDEIEAGRLSRKEGEIAVEADKALEVLREEGSAVAFPEAVTEIRDDMFTVRDHLAEVKVGEITQGVEQDIIAALEEMIGALQKAQKDLENKNQQQPPNSDGGESETPLVDTLSELKMIRALQMRVNTRTKRYAEMTKTEQVDQPELLDALKQLAEREQRIHKVTRDIVVGRNQ
jgi:murein DD-endopeptidase MepM/ murein hydrolase activator NlpD